MSRLSKEGFPHGKRVPINRASFSSRAPPPLLPRIHVYDRGPWTQTWLSMAHCHGRKRRMGSPTLPTLRLDDLTASRDRPPSPPSPPSFSAGVRNTPRWAKCPSTVETRCIMIPITVDIIGRCYCRPPRYVLVAGAKAAPSDSGYNLGMQETTRPLDLADICSSARRSHHGCWRWK